MLFFKRKSAKSSDEQYASIRDNIFDLMRDENKVWNILSDDCLFDPLYFRAYIDYNRKVRISVAIMYSGKKNTVSFLEKKCGSFMMGNRTEISILEEDAPEFHKLSKKVFENNKKRIEISGLKKAYGIFGLK